MEYLGFDPSTSSLLRTHASDCANTPCRPSPRLVLQLARREKGEKNAKIESGVSGFRSQYLVLAKHARFRLRQYPIVYDTWGIRTPAHMVHSLSRRAP